MVTHLIALAAVVVVGFVAVWAERTNGAKAKQNRRVRMGLECEGGNSEDRAVLFRSKIDQCTPRINLRTKGEMTMSTTPAMRA